ncbi:hypothetical protein [Inquilinus ginsengisoli]|uniref:hypothetical protein n=1 Tax=Inquilinus ginsengisoli TaxID=363840 RepID=UPI003D1B95B7
MIQAPRGRAQQGTAPPITFAVLVFPGFPTMAFSSVIEPLRAANILARRECYRWIAVGLSGGKVPASNGFTIEPVLGAREAPLVDRIVACSGGDADHVVAEHAVAWIRRNLRTGAWIGAVADAAFFLARAGRVGRPCLHPALDQPAGLHRGLPRDRAAARPLCHRPQALHLGRRRRQPGYDAGHHRR